MKTKALILGLLALASVAEISSAQAKGGGANSTKVDSVTGIIIAVLDPGGSPIPRVTWNSIDKATFQVQRSKVGDTCCNNASPAGLAVTSWQDSQLPSSGTYIYRVIATLRSGQVAGQSQISYTAPTKGGRYRVSMSAIRVVTPTTDDATMLDGIGDELYAAAVVVRADRATGAKLGASVVKSKEYGDIGDRGIPFANRIRAGTASPSGGLNGGSAIGDPGTAGAETFPFLLWEGNLTNGGEAVVLFPSIWERDTSDVAYRDYTSNWMTASAPILGSPLLQSQYSSTSLAPIVAIPETGGVQQGVTGPIYGNYYIGLNWLSGVDRMIGMAAGTGNPIYSEHIVVLTSEKLAGLVVGGTTDMQIPFNDSIPAGGLYTVILRVERIG